MGGSSFDNVLSITPDNAGNIFVLGTTNSTDFPATATFGTRPATSSSIGDTFVAKIRLSDWSLTWSVVIRPSVPLALALDASGAVYLTGQADFPASFPATSTLVAPTVSAPWGGLFVLKLDPTGSRIVYATILAPYQIYRGAPIAVDNQGQAYVAASGTGPVTPGALFPAVTFGSPGWYLAKLSADGGKVVYCTYLATSATVSANAIAVDEQQNVFVAGAADEYQSAFPSTPGVVQPKHAGSSDAFVMKFRADFSKLEFATLLGGAGGDGASYLRIGDDGSIYLAGSCENGTSSSSEHPFPTTPDAPFRTFNLFQGFVARLSSDASSLLFSTYVNNRVDSLFSTSVSGFALSGDRLFAAYPITLSRGFLSLNYHGAASFESTAVQVFDALTGAALGAALQRPAFKPQGFALSDRSLVIASTGSQISRPVPATINPIGPLDSATVSSRYDITLGKFDLAGAPDHDIDTDRGYLYFESYPGATLEQTLNITSTAEAVPFQVFAPNGASSALSQTSGFTPAAIKVGPVTGSPNSSGDPALLIVSPRARPSIQILPVLTYKGPITSSVDADLIVLPPDGGPGTATIKITAYASFPATGTDIPVSVPFQFNTQFLPSILRLDTLKGTTPATVTVTGQLDSLPLGKSDVEQLLLTVGGIPRDVVVVLSRPGPGPLVSPTSVQLASPLRQTIATGHIQITPPDNTTPFQVLSVTSDLTVAPLSGTGPSTVTISADLTQFAIGTSRRSFIVQSGDTKATVTVSVVVRPFAINVGQVAVGVAPGARLQVYASSAPAAFLSTGAWADLSPAPTNWNGYTFVYRSRTLPILSADPVNLAWDVQLPYDIDLTPPVAPLIMLAPDGTEMSKTTIFGGPAAAAIGIFNTGQGSQAVFKQDGSVVSSSNPVSPGDTIRLYVIGAGGTKPPIAAGLLPDPDATVSPIATIDAEIAGKTATVLRQALDPAFIGVTDLDLRVPKVAAGLQMLGLQSGADRVDLIQIWIAN
jgi:uncharacterized protein (TIGR03437 family)